MVLELGASRFLYFDIDLKLFVQLFALYKIVNQISKSGKRYRQNDNGNIIFIK